jgi:hypothetical protein
VSLSNDRREDHIQSPALPPLPPPLEASSAMRQATRHLLHRIRIPPQIPRTTRIGTTAPQAHPACGHYAHYQHARVPMIQILVSKDEEASGVRVGRRLGLPLRLRNNSPERTQSRFAFLRVVYQSTRRATGTQSM